MPSLTPPFNTAQLTPTEQLLKDLGCKYTRRANGVLVVQGGINLSDKGLTVLPDLSAVVVEGSFYCERNRLTSLAGAPQFVGGYFSCYKNQLISLAGAPQVVAGSFFLLR